MGRSVFGEKRVVVVRLLFIFPSLILTDGELGVARLEISEIVLTTHRRHIPHPHRLPRALHRRPTIPLLLPPRHIRRPAPRQKPYLSWSPNLLHHLPSAAVLLHVHRPDRTRDLSRANSPRLRALRLDRRGGIAHQPGGLQSLFPASGAVDERRCAAAGNEQKTRCAG